MPKPFHFSPWVERWRERETDLILVLCESDGLSSFCVTVQSKSSHFKNSEVQE
jgi:hypothetical protein